jgi:hypothetical protein
MDPVVSFYNNNNKNNYNKKNRYSTGNIEEDWRIEKEMEERRRAFDFKYEAERVARLRDNPYSVFFIGDPHRTTKEVKFKPRVPCEEEKF